jgi:integrase
MRGVHGFEWNPKTKEARFDVSVPDASGRRHRHRQTETHETRADALKAWSAFRDRVRAGRAGRKAWTLRTYWEAKRKGFAAIMSDSRFSNVAGIVEARLLPVLGDTLLEKIHGPAVLDLLARMGKGYTVRHGESLTRRTYAPSTIRGTVAVLKMLVRDAFDREEIDRFPLRGLRRLPIERETPLRQEMSTQEHARFIAAFDDEAGFRKLMAAERWKGAVSASPHFGGKPRAFGGGLKPEGEAVAVYFERLRASRPLFVVALETGLRRGDLLALKWSSVDLKNGWMRVTMKKTRTEAVIPLSKACRESLAEARKHAPFSPVVFVGEDEKSPVAEMTLRRHFELAKKLAGISRRLRFHDLRHTFASRLASCGVPLQVIQKALGHTSARMSERYARPDENALAAIRTALDSERMDTEMDTGGEKIMLTLEEGPATPAPLSELTGTPRGIRTLDLHLERVASWAARRWGHADLTAISSKDW